MADDDDDLNLDESDSGSSSGKKGGGIGGLLPGLLKWVAIAIGAVLFIVTIVVITFNFLNKNANKQQTIPISSEYAAKREILDWNTSLGQLRLKTKDSIPASVIVDIALGYKKDDKAAPSEIIARTVELKDFLRQFFTSRTAAELTINEEKLKIEIRNAINDDILSSSKISDVRFLTFDVIEQ